MKKLVLESPTQTPIEPMCDTCRWKIHVEKPMPVQSRRHHRTPITWISAWCTCPHILPDRMPANHSKPLRLAFRLCRNHNYEPLGGNPAD